MSHPAAPVAEPPPLLEWGPLLEQHPLAHFVYDPTSLRMLAANRVALQRYGYSRDELLSLTRADLLEPSELRGLVGS